MLLQPNAKINLGLNVVRKRPDGYHDLETIFYPIPLHDNLDITPLNDLYEPSFRLRGMTIAGDIRTNLVYKVYEQLRTDYQLPSVDVELYKSIPTGAGLGGGSSDAAYMMKGLNELFDLRMTDAEMEQRVSVLGADCAFFIRNKPMFATGIGNVFTPVSVSLKGWYFVLIKPEKSVSTREAYAYVTPQPATLNLKESITTPVENWKDTVKNDFEPSIFKQYPAIGVIKETLYDMGAVYASMSGSGSSVFGLFRMPIPSVRKIFKDCFVFETQLQF